MKKHISILGSTGSIGVNALKIAEFFSTAKLIYSGIEVRKFRKITLKINIYKVLVYKDPQLRH